MIYNLAVTDDDLCPPFASGDSLTKLAWRMGGASESGAISAPLVPGWDWEVIMYGLTAAINRYRDGIGQSKGIVTRAAVGEALWWIAAADEFIRKRISDGMSLAAYSTAIQRTTAGRRFAGLVFLRNRAGHQLAAALTQDYFAETSFNIELENRSTFPITARVNLRTHLSPFDDSPHDGYYFAPSNSLPNTDLGYEEKFNRDACYDELVANRRVTDVLNAVESSLRDAISFQWADGVLKISVTGSGVLPAQQ